MSKEVKRYWKAEVEDGGLYVASEDHDAAIEALLAERALLRSVLQEARQVVATALRTGAPDWFETDEDIASHHTIKRIDSALQGEQP